MFLDFASVPEVAVPRFKGGEGQALVRKFEDEQGKILILTLPAGSTIGHHVHEGSFEVMHFLSGEGVCTDDGEEVAVRAGMTHYCAVGQPQRGEHRLRAAGDPRRGAQREVN